MCQFASWVEYKDKVYFLTDKKLSTKEGKQLKKYLNYPSSHYFEDIKGHGAICKYHYELNKKGKDCECTDFNNIEFFPKEIVKAIKNMEMTKIGYSFDLLNGEGKKLFKKIRQSALAEYRKIEQSALAEYEKIEQSALAEYNQKILSEFWKIFKQKKYRNPLWK